MSEQTYCDIERRDSGPRWDMYADTFAPEPGTWAPDCGHASCKADDERHPQWHDWDCPAASCRWDTLRQTCDAEAGHDGPHQFAPLPELPDTVIDVGQGPLTVVLT